MIRSLNALRPASASARGLTTQVRPMSLALRAQPRATRPVTALPPAAALLFRRAYATGTTQGTDKTAASANKHDPSKANPNVDEQNATASAAEESSWDQFRGATRDFAKMIGGSGTYPTASSLGMETSSHGHGGSITEDFLSVTKGLYQEVPRSALAFGGAGLIPYIGTSAATVVLARQASLAAQGTDQAALDNALSLLHTVEAVQITYGAVILSFLGAIHWGFEFAGTGGQQGWRRLAMGTMPLLFAWPTTFISHGAALALQWAGFTTTWFVDQRATSNGWTTNWYSAYRFYLSIVVGFSIIATFAGTSYYGAGAGAVTQTQVKKFQHTTERVSPVARLDRVKEKEKPGSSGILQGTVAGDMQVDQREDGEGYLKLRNIAHEEEEAEEAKQEAEEKKKEAQQAVAEKQDKKEEGQIDKPGKATGMKSEGKDRTGKNENPDGDSKSDDEKTGGMEDAVEKSKKE